MSVPKLCFWDGSSTVSKELRRDTFVGQAFQPDGASARVVRPERTPKKSRFDFFSFSWQSIR